jgi:uncharacterized protein (TIGR03437 family)
MKFRKIDQMRSYGIAIFFFLACAGILSAQFTITTTSPLPAGNVGVAYSTQLQTSGAEGQVSWYVNCPPDANCNPGGSPAPGLALDGESGAITGTPTTAGTFQFTVQAEYDDSAPTVASMQFSLTIAAPCTPTISPAPPLPGADINIKYTVMFSANGCPEPAAYIFTAQAVTPFGGETGLPAGLSLAANGVLSGTPTQASPSGTPSAFVITATGPNGSSNQIEYTLTVNPLPTITTTSPLPTGPVGVPYSQQLAATGGVPGPNGYTFLVSGTLPPGINITSSGLLSGTPTQAGTFNQFNIGVEDSLSAQTSSPFSVTFVSGVPQIQVSPQSLTFNADFDGNPPPTQAIGIVPGAGATPPVTFTVSIDGGQSTIPAPSWISVSPTSGTAPAGLVVSVNQGNLAAGPYTARILILDSNKLASDVAVSLNVQNTAQKLNVTPSTLSFTARAAAPGNLVKDLFVSNTGAVPLAFTASVTGASSWISGISPSSGQTVLNGPVILQVQVDTSGLAVGGYHDTIHISSPAGNADIPVSLFVAASGPALSVTPTGFIFTARQNGGSAAIDTLEIVNVGDPSSTVNWTASLVSGADWLNLVSPSGTATAAAPGVLTLGPVQNASQMTPGPYYALIKIEDPNSLNSPQFVSAVLNLEPDSAAPGPNPTPGGLFFTATAGGSSPASQPLTIYTSSAAPVVAGAATTTTLPANPSWLSVTPSSVNATGANPGSVSVSVDPASLTAGIYTGNVNISIGGWLQSVNVTLVVLPGSTPNAIAHSRPEVLGCTPSHIAITENGLVNNFAVPAGWPATLIVQLNDDCGSLVLNGNVVAGFSNGDPALALPGDSLGNYTATWSPGALNSQMVVTLNATAANLKPAIAKLNGGVGQNQTPPPTLASGGTLNNLNPVLGGSLAPGTIAQVYGSGLAASSVSTGVLPLPTIFDNTFAQIGAYQAPLFYLSSGQINVEIPSEITGTQQVPILLSVNNALTLPRTLNIVPTAPGVLSYLNGPTASSPQNGAFIIAQHSNATASLVTKTDPANPGEYVVMYLVGLGATDPSVTSGTPSPSATLARVTHPVTVTVDALPATVAFAGLTPGFVGLYQIDFQVPAGANSGNAQVTVTQNGIAANPTLLPISP